jgi:hypothetical protein
MDSLMAWGIKVNREALFVEVWSLAMLIKELQVVLVRGGTGHSVGHNK